MPVPSWLVVDALRDASGGGDDAEKCDEAGADGEIVGPLAGPSAMRTEPCRNMRRGHGRRKRLV